MQTKTQYLTLVHHFLEKSATLYPDKIAYIQEGLRETYKNIDALANTLARYLIGTGVQKGDRVVLLIDNCLEYVVSYYGILKAGAVAVPFSSEIKTDGIKHLLDEIDTEIIITSSRFERLLKATGIENYSLKALIISRSKLKWENDSVNTVDFEQIVESDTSTRSLPDSNPEDLASIIYTSGSTGSPKGVMLSHKNIVSNTLSICKYLQLTNKDVQMVVLPFFYVMGKSLLNTHFCVGGTIVVNNKFAYPATVIQQMIDEKVTGFSGVPSTYAYLLHRSPFKSRINEMTNLRYCSQAGGHMAVHIKQELRNMLPSSVSIVIMYGATEASARLSYLEPSKLTDKIDSIGKAIPGVELQILNKHGKVVEKGQVGELVGSGDNIMKGYWNDESLTSKVLDDSGYHTGDLCYQDEDGYFFLVGRKDEMIKVGGHKINPQEVEDTIIASGHAVEAIVVGVPDKLLGYRLVALIAPIDITIDSNDIIAQCNRVLPKYKIPSKIVLVKALPKKVNGKIDKGKCLKLLV